MNNYKKILELRCFTLKEAAEAFRNVNTAKTALRNCKAHGMLRSVKRNLYVAVSLETDAPTASPFEIASNITPSSHISHYSAFEYYGVANQVFYDVYVSSKERFDTFDFDGRTYKYIADKLDDGVLTERHTKVTDMERTIIDSIKDFSRIGGLEELLHCLSAIPFADEGKLMHYLKEYNNQFLFQKTGYILALLQDELKISNDFIEKCCSMVNRSTRYLYPDIVNEKAVFDRKWRLFVPSGIHLLTGDGGDIDV